MKCPNGHKGGMFCCEDYVNQWMKVQLDRMQDYCALEEPLIHVTLDQYKFYQGLAEEQEREL